MQEITHIEFYHNKLISKKETEVLRDRVKNIHYYQAVSPEDFKQAMKPNMIKLDNNVYYKEFNLMAN